MCEALKLLIPSGHLFKHLVEHLANIGITVVLDERSYHARMVSDWLQTSGQIVKPRAIPQLLALDLFDVGFTGLDLLREADYETVEPIFDLGLNPVRMVVAVASGHTRLLSDPPKRPLRIATEYVAIADRWATSRNLAHVCIQTYGKTEGYASSVADIVFDCVETGDTMRANGLIIVDTIMESSTWMVASKAALAGRKREAIEQLKRRLEDLK